MEPSRPALAGAEIGCLPINVKISGHVWHKYTPIAPQRSSFVPHQSINPVVSLHSEIANPAAIGMGIALLWCWTRIISLPRSLPIRIIGACTGFMRRLAVPANESHLTVALVLCMLIMALLLCGIVWQSGIIVYQRDLIRALWEGRFGG